MNKGQKIQAEAFGANIYNSLIMDQPNLFYKWDVIQNVGEFLSLKDLLSTATLSKEYNHILKKYVKEHFALENDQNHNEFQQLKLLFNRKIFHYNSKHEKFAKANPSNFIARSIKCQEHYTVVETLDCQFKLVKTHNLLSDKIAELISLPQIYKFVHITEGGFLYCAQSSKITRYNMNTEALANGETLQLKGDVQDMICGFRFAIAVVRDSPQAIRFLIFDNTEKLEGFKLIQIPFNIHQFSIQNNLVMSKSFNYFIFNDTLYEFNIKTGAIHHHPEFAGRKIVKILGGKNHFVAFEKVKELAETWSTEDVIKFAQKEGFEDFIKIFKAEKVTGKVLLNMDKKYMEEVLGIENIKFQIKLRLRLEECNQEDPESYVVHTWGRASEGQLATNPSKEITKPIKLKLPLDCEVFALSGNFTMIHNKKNNATLINAIDDKTNKLQWKEITKKKIWSLSTVEENVIMVGSATKDRVPQRESEGIVVEKKEKLRTAKNIIDKITWDEHLKPEEFKVGYLDKYDGILEIPFSDLEQTDVVKEYRIEYFKKGALVVWDKKKRIDIL